MPLPLTPSRFALVLSVAIVAISAMIAPTSARAEKPTEKPAAAAGEVKKVPRPKAKAKAKPAPKPAAPAAQKVPRAIGPKPEAAPAPAKEPAKDKDGKEEDPLERKNAGKLDGHKWRPHVRN